MPPKEITTDGNYYALSAPLPNTITTSPNTVVVTSLASDWDSIAFRTAQEICKSIAKQPHNIVLADKYGLPPEDQDAKTILKEYNEEICVGIYKDGELDEVEPVLPAITNVEIYNYGVVKVWFSDGSTETAKASEEDKDYYNPEIGVSICITKKLLHDKLGGNGSSVYNKLVDYAMRICNESVVKRCREEQEERRRKALFERRRAKAQKKKELKADARREEQIEIQAEAYLRAMKRAKEQE